MPKKLKHMLKERAVKLYEQKEAEFPEPEHIRETGACGSSEGYRHINGWITSMIWISCVRVSDLQAYGQRDPKVEYKMIGYEMFDEMTRAISA